MTKEFEPRMLMQMFDVAFGTGEQVIDTQDVMPLLKKPVNQMRAQKPGTACYKHPLLRKIVTSHAKILV